MAEDDFYAQSLIYHRLNGRPGKLEVTPTKPCDTQRDLSLAYSPGVAEPCRKIAETPTDVYRYTNKGNLVAVITNGTAVLGLGDIGPLAGKPVMEGKAVLFKKFANIDVYDIEIDAKDPEKFIAAVEAIAPTFGGINLEDIKGPECFEIETTLKERLDIPVFHDDQHGTAIISAAAFLNACELTDRKPEDVKCVFNGAGAAGISCAKLFVHLGVKRENLLLCDSSGVIYAGRTKRMNKYKEEFARETELRTLEEAMVGADCFIGCSVGDAVTPAMLSSMAKDPIVFAMANPTPEIDYPLAVETRSDVIMATGRSDYPNQVNNVLGFPFVFRGALDCGARTFNMEMMIAAVRALSALAKEPVTQTVSRAYGGEQFTFGRDYLIPKPFDPRVLPWVSTAVARAAIESGVARLERDLDEYREKLMRQVDAGRTLVALPMQHARGALSRIALPEGYTPKLTEVARRAIEERIARPVIVGEAAKIREAMQGVPADSYEIADPAKAPDADRLVELMQARQPLDTPSRERCLEELQNPYVYATLLTELGTCDGLVAAGDRPYAKMVSPILRYATRRAGVSRVAGLHLLQLKDRALFFADTALIPDPSAEELAEIAMRATRVVQRLDITPRIGFISYANFSARADTDQAKLRRAYKIVRQLHPEMTIFPPVQADVAVEPERYGALFGDRIPQDAANILIFPNLHAANAAFRLTRVIGEGTAIGPMLLGLKRPANVLARGSTPDEIFNMLAVTAYNAERRKAEMAEGTKTQLWRQGGSEPVQVLDNEVH